MNMKNEEIREFITDIRVFVKYIHTEVLRLEKFLDAFVEEDGDIVPFIKFRDIFADAKETELPFEKIFPGTKSKVLERKKKKACTGPEDLVKYKVEPMAESEPTKPTY